jgi:eukaryotic-like serine/threonine-protein kinase
MTAAQGLPPSLDGFTFIKWLGGGGFADVFLYQQHLPERRVAVKVLRETVDEDEARRVFNAEANLMARMSTHPNIVTIYSAGVSKDRRPYLVMEYYPLAHFGDRMKHAQLPVHEVLAVGVKVASAVETAHRARIIHRDIKPANILTSDFGEPGLTDFGISATQTDQSTDESMGFSPPYAPPEILADEHPGNEQSDIYSLAATLWALLAGHSPFELPGQSNSRAEVIRRGLNQPVPPLPRSDVPPSLEYALQNCLSKDPSGRPSSARMFAVTLQGVEQELGYRPTPLNLLQDASTSGPAIIDKQDLLGEKTKIGKGKVVNPEIPMVGTPFGGEFGATTIGQTRRPNRDDGLISGVPQAAALAGSVSGQVPSIERLHQPPPVEEEGTIRVARNTPTLPAPPSAPPLQTRTMPHWAWLAMTLGLLSILAVVGVVVFGGKGSRPTTTTLAAEDPGSIDTQTTPATVSRVTNLVAARDGTTVHFTWTTAASKDVQYIVTRIDTDAGTPPPSTVVSVGTFDVVSVAPGVAPCVSVFAIISGRVQSPKPAPTKCATG